MEEIESERRKLIINTAPPPLPMHGSSSTIGRDEAAERIKRLREMMLNTDKEIIPDLKNTNSDTE
jgi:hypothetical protein